MNSSIVQDIWLNTWYITFGYCSQCTQCSQLGDTTRLIRGKSNIQDCQLDIRFRRDIRNENLQSRHWSKYCRSLSWIVHFSQFHHVGTASDILPGFVLGSCPLVGWGFQIRFSGWNRYFTLLPQDTDNNFRREAVRAADVSPQLQFLSTFKSVENIFVESSTERKNN